MIFPLPHRRQTLPRQPRTSALPFRSFWRAIFRPDPFTAAMAIFAGIEADARARADMRLLYQLSAVRQAYTTKALRS